MANRTVKEAATVKGTNPQYLVEKIIRTRIYDSLYWKEQCFGLSAEDLVDKGLDLRYAGGVFGGNVKPTPFLCLCLKMLQLQPDKDIAVEFIRQEDSKYIRALGAMYIRLTLSSVEIYKYLEPLYNDYRRMRFMNKQGRFELVHMDDFIDHLLREERYCDIQLPRLQKRQALEEVGELKPYVSALDEDIERATSSEEEEEEDDRRRKERPKLVSRRPGRERSRSRERGERSSKRDRSRDRDDRDRRERDRDRKDRDRKEKDDKHRKKSSKSKEEEDQEIEEANALRAKLGLAPLQR
uniref:Pre-mRNA-splicing factor 38 n=1 Tax=Steinernema glaseri TaxID=37863 RepID=A0A1I7YXS2_9BILA